MRIKATRVIDTLSKEYVAAITARADDEQISVTETMKTMFREYSVSQTLQIKVSDELRRLGLID